MIEDLVMEKVEEGGGKDEKENAEDEDGDLSRRYNLNWNFRLILSTIPGRYVQYTHTHYNE